MRMLAKSCLQGLRQELALPRDLCKQVLLIDDALHGKSGSAGRSVSHIGVPVQKTPGALGDGIGNLVVDEERADRLIAGPQSFGDE